MRVVRRALGALGLLAVASLAFVWWRIGILDVTPVRPGVWMLAGVGSNVTVVATADGAIVVDSMTVVRQGRLIHAKVREPTGKPVAALLNTHYHLDHTHGNPAFPVGTKVVSTARTLEHLRTRDADWWADSPARDLLPNATFEALVRCLSQGNEVVMAPKLVCVARRAGPDSAASIAERAHMPLGERGWDGDWDKVCADASDPRRLPADVIKRIAANKDAQIAPSGIRIIAIVLNWRLR